MRRVAFVILAILIAALAAWIFNARMGGPAPAAAPAPAASVAPAVGTILWQNDYSVAVDEARRDRKPIFLYFSAVWCKPCQDLKTTTWADSQVITALQTYEPVELDFNKNPTLAAKFNATSLPAFFVVDPATDKILRSYTAGALGPEEFVRWIKG